MQAFFSVFRPFESLFAFNQATFSGCMDVIVVQQNDGKYKCTPFHVRFGHFKLMKVKGVSVILEVNDNVVGIEMKIAEDGHAYFIKEVVIDGKKIVKQSLRLPDENLKRLQLNPGKNKIRYIVKTNLQGEQFVEARIFLWSQPLKLVFSDIDGTVTKSDVMGHVMSILKKDWTHESIAALFSKFIENGCKMIYITARPFSQYEYTLSYMDRVKQADSLMPEGPILMSPDVLLDSAKREVIFKTPERLKIPIIKDVKKLVEEFDRPFIAGFGNRNSDAISYIYGGMEKGQVFIINKQSQIQRLDGPEILTYEKLSQNFDHYFSIL